MELYFCSGHSFVLADYFFVRYDIVRSFSIHLWQDLCFYHSVAAVECY